MIIDILRPMTIEVDAVRLTVPIRYDDDMEALADCPGVVGKTLQLTIGIDTGVVRDWPAGRTADIHLKVVDQGTYELLAGSEIVASRTDDYVPGFFPGDHYGDYVILRISANGMVTGWRPRANDVVDAFALGGGQ